MCNSVWLVCVSTGRLGQALDMMNHAVSGTFVPGVRENMAYFTSNERRATVYAILTLAYYCNRSSHVEWSACFVALYKPNYPYSVCNHLVSGLVVQLSYMSLYR